MVNDGTLIFASNGAGRRDESDRRGWGNDALRCVAGRKARTGGIARRGSCRAGTGNLGAGSRSLESLREAGVGGRSARWARLKALVSPRKIIYLLRFHVG